MSREDLAPPKAVTPSEEEEGFMTLEIRFESPKEIDENRLWEMVLDENSGKPRLSKARRFFQPLTQRDLHLLKEAFKYWRGYHEYLLMKAENVLTGEVQYFAVKCSKRGNDVFGDRLDQHLGFLKADEEFFDSDVFEEDPQKRVKTKLLWITLTYDSNRCSLNDAWENVAEEFNLWITNLRNRYGRISYVCFPQAFPDPKGKGYGYPHFHVIMLFKDAEFSVFPRFETDREGKSSLVFRIAEKFDLESQGKWHSFIDIKALKSMRAVWNYAKRHCYNAGYGESDEAILNNAIMWLYGKKSFNMSGDFRERYTEFIRGLHKSKTVYPLLDSSGFLAEWKLTLIGIFSVFELCIGEDPPPWTLRLEKSDVDRLLDKKFG